MTITMESLRQAQISIGLNERVKKEIVTTDLLNDVVQVGTKAVALFLLPEHQRAPYWAELSRNGIDFLQHLIRYGTTYFRLTPTAKYPYGIGKLNNILMLFPACLYTYFGGTSLYHAWQIVLTPAMDVTSLFSPIPVLAMATAIATEVYSTVRNYHTAEVLLKEKPKTLKDYFMLLFVKRQRLMQRHRFENLVTLISVIAPIAATLGTVAIPSPMIVASATALVGLAQLYLAGAVTHDNFPVLIGRGIDEETRKGIHAIIASDPFVESVRDEKGIFIGNEQFRFAANVTYNLEKLEQSREDDKAVEKILSIDDKERRRVALAEHIEAHPERLRSRLVEKNDDLENKIRAAYPDCEEVDFELDYNKLLEVKAAREARRDHSTIPDEIAELVLSEAGMTRLVASVLRKEKESVSDQTLSGHVRQKLIALQEEIVEPQFDEDVAFELMASACEEASGAVRATS